MFLVVTVATIIAPSVTNVNYFKPHTRGECLLKEKLNGILIDLIYFFLSRFKETDCQLNKQCGLATFRLVVSTLATLDLSNLIDRLTVKSRKVKGGGFQAESAIPQVAIFIYVRFGTRDQSCQKTRRATVSHRLGSFLVYTSPSSLIWNSRKELGDTRFRSVLGVSSYPRVQIATVTKLFIKQIGANLL